MVWCERHLRQKLTRDFDRSDWFGHLQMTNIILKRGGYFLDWIGLETKRLSLMVLASKRQAIVNAQRADVNSIQSTYYCIK